MFSLSAFADEIAPDLATQLTVLSRLQIGGLDLRSVDGKNVMDLTTDDLKRIMEHLAVSGIRVQSIGSPVNKVPLAQAEGEIERLRKAIGIAKAVGTVRVRIFAPEGDDGDAILALLAKQRDLAAEAGIVLLLENDAKYWNAFPENARRMFDALGGSSFRAAYDFANAQLIGYSPDDWFPWLTPHLDTLHIKDARGGQVVPAGEGDARIAETLKDLTEAGWSGPLTLEPHLTDAGPLGGFSGEKRFEVAANAFRLLATRAGVMV